MRFTTIWTLSGLPLRERIDRTLDWACMELADLLPKRVSYWIAMVQLGKATMKSPHVPATPVDDVLRNLGRIREGKDVTAWDAPEDSWFKQKEYATVASEQLHISDEEPTRG